MIHGQVVLAASSAYGQSGSSQYILLLAGAAVVALAIAGLYLWNHARKPRAAEAAASPEDLLGELCQAHELSRIERTLIMQVARIVQLPQHASVFLDPKHLDQAAAATDPDAPRYRALREKLFGSLR